MAHLTNAFSLNTIENGTFKPSRIPHALAIAGLSATFLAALYSGWGDNSLPDFAAWTASGWALLALLSALLVTPRRFVQGYLLSLLPFLIAWRVAAMNGAWALMVVASLTAVVLVLQFADCVATDWRKLRGRPDAWLGTLAWQATLVRLCFGLNELCHSTEKLFAGVGSFNTLVHGFQGFGLGAYAAAFVVLGGMIELVSAISVGLGLLARLGAGLSLVYFLTATIGFGGEWARGYAWASPGGGGWEYVMLLLVVFSGVMMTGAGRFSIDDWLLRQRVLPDWSWRLCTNALGRHSVRHEGL